MNRTHDLLRRISVYVAVNTWRSMNGGRYIGLFLLGRVAIGVGYSPDGYTHEDKPVPFLWGERVRKPRSVTYRAVVWSFSAYICRQCS